MNRLYFGHNLQWLRDARAASLAQFHAFTDTWSWADADETYHQFIDACPNVAVVEMMEAFRLC